MATTAFGKIAKFQVGAEPITGYLERVELKFAAHGVASDKKWLFYSVS